MSDYAETALDQLRLAADVSERLDDNTWWERQHTHALVSAAVHALLEVAQSVREATPEYWP